jgi:predicted dehydrogenase
MTLRLGIIGAGGFVGVHLRALEHLSDRITVTAVADVDRSAAESVAASTDARAYGSYDSMLAAEELDAIDVLLPHHLHPEAVTAAAAHVPAIFLEKPLAADVAGGERIVQTVARTGVRLLVGHQLLFNPVVRAAGAAIERGDIGVPTLARSIGTGWLHFGPRDFRLSAAQTGGGMVADGLVHSIYVLIGLLGPVARVCSLVGHGVRSEMEGEDQATALLEFASGAQAVAQGSFGVREPGWQEPFPGGWNQSTTIHGDRGTLRFSITPEPRLEVFDGARDWRDQTPPCEFLDSYRREMEHFIDVAVGDAEPKVDASQSLVYLRVVQAIYDSIESGAMVSPQPDAAGVSQER